jgi:hypothetical protein
MEIMLKNKNGFQVNISLSIFFIAFCDLFTDFPSYYKNRIEVILCLVQQHLNGLNDFESRWRMTNEMDALPPAEMSKQSRK